MAMPALQPHFWHRSELAELPDDGNRYEVLDGELLVTPQAAHAHQLVAFELATALGAYVRAPGIGHLVAPGAVLFGGNELQPDIQVIPGPGVGLTWETAPAPMLVVEVLSPSTQERDRGVKLAAYRERLGIPAVWLVDLDARAIHVAEGPGGPLRTVRDTLRWHPAGAVEPLTLNVQELFRAAIGA
jgi:Uma2 family endonuclease